MATQLTFIDDANKKLFLVIILIKKFNYYNFFYDFIKPPYMA